MSWGSQGCRTRCSTPRGDGGNQCPRGAQGCRTELKPRSDGCCPEVHRVEGHEVETQEVIVECPGLHRVTGHEDVAQDVLAKCPGLHRVAGHDVESLGAMGESQCIYI